MSTAPRSGLPVPRASRTLDNLRSFVILLVLAFHSVLAYLNFLPASPFPFDTPPYLWRAFPIVDTERWFGFDLFCAWQDVFLMSLFFFLSGLFVWPSLERKGARIFLRDRVLRIGVPFTLVVALLMPLANYPTYLQTAVDPGITAFFRHWLALPFWSCGPMWFLWLLLVADFAAAGRHWPPDAMPSRCCEFVDSRLRRSPPARASAVPYGQAGENAMRFPPCPQVGGCPQASQHPATTQDEFDFGER